MAELYDEIDEDVRADALRATLRRALPWLLGLAAAIVLGVAIWQGWRWHERRQAMAAADAYVQAMDLAGGDDAARAKARALFGRLAGQAPAGYRDLAALQEAALLFPKDPQAARAGWDRLAREGAVPTIRHLAGLLWAEHGLDDGDPVAVRAHLASSLAEGDPWRPLAQEAEALLALRLGEEARAREGFAKLARGVATPPVLRQRAELMLRGLGGDAR